MPRAKYKDCYGKSVVPAKMQSGGPPMNQAVAKKRTAKLPPRKAAGF